MIRQVVPQYSLMNSVSLSGLGWFAMFVFANDPEIVSRLPVLEVFNSFGSLNNP